jgi:plastocyanin
MSKKIAALAIALIAGVLVACGGRGGGGNVMPAAAPVSMPGLQPDLMVTANLPPHTAGEELPSAGLGTVNSSYWHATLGGYTQQRYSQALGFPPGTKITLKNLSKTTPHTLNVVGEIAHPPANFPSKPFLRTNSHGYGYLGPDYSSGVIEPGKSVTITLKKPGIYLIGCHFHYHEGMRDVIRVANGAGPGQQATPSPKPTSHPSSTPSQRPTPSYMPSYSP